MKAKSNFKHVAVIGSVLGTAESLKYMKIDDASDGTIFCGVALNDD